MWFLRVTNFSSSVLFELILIMDTDLTHSCQPININKGGGGRDSHVNYSVVALQHVMVGFVSCNVMDSIKASISTIPATLIQLRINC